MTIKRGALLVIEGCDRAGKSTQVLKLVKELKSRGIKAESRRFPGTSPSKFLFFFKKNHLPNKLISTSSNLKQTEKRRSVN